MLGAAYLNQAELSEGDARRTATGKAQRCLHRALELDPCQAVAGPLFVDLLLRAASAPINPGVERDVLE